MKMVTVIIEDAIGLHAFAESILKHLPALPLFLPGAANGANSLQKALIQRNNAQILHQKFINIAETVFVFHDLRAESQIFLNSKYNQNIRFVLLEDGIAIYEPHCLLVGSPLSILKRKIFFDPKWKHAREIGLHPKLMEVKCFYPHLLRNNLRHLEVRSLPIAAPNDWGKKYSKIELPENKQCAAIGVPHSLSVEIGYFLEFLNTSLDYCKTNELTPLLKFHPSDKNAINIARLHSPDFCEIPQCMPLEFFILTHQQVSTLIGTRTSALHISKAIRHDIDYFYHEPSNSKEGKKWGDFLDAVGIAPLPLKSGHSKIHNQFNT